MKLIIDLPDNVYKHIKEYYEKNDNIEATYSYIYDGIPLEEELEKIKAKMTDLDIVSTNGNNAKQVFLLTKDLMISVVENHISKLKGKTNEIL